MKNDATSSGCHADRTTYYAANKRVTSWVRATNLTNQAPVNLLVKNLNNTLQANKLLGLHYISLLLPQFLINNDVNQQIKSQYNLMHVYWILDIVTDKD